MAKVNRQAVFDGEKSPMQILAEDTAAAEKQVIFYTEQVRKLNTELTTTQTLAKAMQSQSGTSTGSSLGDLEKSNAAHKEAITLAGRHQAAKSNLEKSTKELAIETNLLKISEEKLWQEMLRTEKAEKALADQTERLAQRQEKLNQKNQQATQAYARVQSWLTKLNQEHRNLAIRQELGAKLTAEEAKRMDILAGRIGRYDAALKNVDASQGKHFRNVGNYKSGFDGLGNSINQLSRELPAFANSIQTGFMAISNNLPIFFDEVKRIRMANESLKAQGEQVTSVFKQLAAGVFSIGTALSLGVTALTFLGPKLFEWIGSLGGANKALEENKKRQQAVNEQTKKAAEYVGEESAEYVGYILELKKTNAGSAERSKLMTEINEKYGRTLKNIKDEALFQAQLNQEINNYIKYQRARYEIQKNQDLINRNLAAQDKLRAETARKLGIDAKLLDAFAENVRKSYDQVSESVGDYVKTQEQVNQIQFNPTIKEELQKYVGVLIEADKRLENYGFSILEADMEMEELGFDTEKTTKETEKLTLALKEFDDELARRLDLGEQERKLRQSMTEIEQDNRINVVSRLAQQELENQKEFAENSGEIFVDTLEGLINEEFQMRKDAAIQRAEFEKAEALKRVDATRVLEYERLTKERDELLKQEGLTASGREKIRASYAERLEELNSRMLDEERIVALQREKIELELQQTLGNLDQARLDRLKEVNDQLIEAQQDYAVESQKKTEDQRKKELEDFKKHQKEMADLRKKGVDLAIKELERESKAREEQYKKEYNSSKDLENQLIAQIEAGSDSAKDSLAVQKQVTAEKLALAELEQRRQAALKQIEVGYQILEQLIAKGDSAPVAAVKTVGLLEFVKGIFKPKSYFVGTDDTGTVSNPMDGNGGRPAILHNHEQVLSYKDRKEASRYTGGRLKTRKDLIAASQFYDSFRVNKMIMLDGMQRAPIRTDQTHSPIAIAQLRKLDLIASKFDEMPKEIFDQEIRDGILYAFHEYKKGNDRQRTYINV